MIMDPIFMLLPFCGFTVFWALLLSCSYLSDQNGQHEEVPSLL